MSTVESPIAPDIAYLPCSQSQKRFWFEALLHPDNPGLNVAVRWQLDGNVVHAHLEHAWQLIVARHATLRTRFATIDGEPLGIVEPSVVFRVPLVDLTTLGEAAAAREAERIASIEARGTFDIGIAPLIRVTHVRVSTSRSIVLVTAHHTVCDGWSIGILAREMGEVCAHLSAGRTPALPDVPLTYADYVAWELDGADGVATPLDDGAALDVAPFEIVPDFPRPPVQTANGDIVSVLIERSVTDALAAAARTSGSTLFMAAYAVLLVLLHRSSGQTAITIGTQIAGREELDFEPLVGTFINTIALQADVADDPTFEMLLDRARDIVTDAFETRHVPLEELVKRVNPKRDLSRNALFSVNFVYQRSFIDNATYGSFTLTDLPSTSAGPICDLNFFMVERPEGWRASCEFNTDLYRRSTVDGLVTRFVRLMRTLATMPAEPISRVPILEDDERRRILARAAGPVTAYGRDEHLPGLFARAVALQPTAIATVDAQSALTYAELDRRSNRLARYLQRAGVRRGDAVGVALPRSTAVPVALLAILKCGATYVPLDPAYPAERLEFIAADAGVLAIVTDAGARERVPGGARAIDLDASADAIARTADAAPACDIAATDRAFVMYTSGSSGRPKGVAVNHRAIARLVRATNYVDVTPDDTVLHAAPLAFDASTFEIWAPLLNGGRLAIAPPEPLTLGELDRTLQRFGVTTLWLTAAMFREAVDAELASFAHLRRVLAGGDVVSPVHAQRFLAAYPACRLINGYGPTENTTFSCAYAVPSADAVATQVPIGGPIANSTAYVLDRRLQLVPAGVVGELCVGGDGLADGYVNLPALTAERFVPDSLSRTPGARLYRTGDQVRQRDDGVIEFLGRIDGQVKIRGFRIELRELDVVLARHPNVADAVTVVRESDDDKTIAAYVVPRTGRADEFDVAALRAWLGERLPAFMLPSAIVPLPAFPLSPNGKVDTRKLPLPAPAAASVAATPFSATEARLAAILADIIGVAAIDRTADLFALGFHSMLALRFVARAQAEFGLELPLRAIYERPSVAAIATLIGVAPDAVVPSSEPIVRLNAGGTRPPLIFFHGDLFADGLYAHKLAAALGADQPLYAVAPHGTSGQPLLHSVEAMADDFARKIRAVQPHGPYRLGGFCASGLVAYEVARRLLAAGERVERVALLNASPMPPAAIPPLDGLIRRIGLNATLSARLRDVLCYNLARAHAGLVSGPRGIAAFLRTLAPSGSGRAPRIVDPLEPLEPFEHRRSPEQTKNSFAHVVAALTYHPGRYDGDVALIWGEDQETMLDDPTMGWGAVARHVDVVPMRGGHVGSLRGRIGELADMLEAVLGPAARPHP